jgi:hypothetical protein
MQHGRTAKLTVPYPAPLAGATGEKSWPMNRLYLKDIAND